ncbi:hypothetical protein RI065_05995 [Mycoplasmatota bacterium zrk1]
MEVDNILFKGLRKFNSLNLNEASDDICTASALSQFETGKINLTDKIKAKLLDKYGIKIIPHEADIGFLKRKVSTFSRSQERFYYPASLKIYDFLISRQGSLCFDLNLIIDSFNELATFELIQFINHDLAIKRITFLKSLKNIMSRVQLQKFYFNLGLVELILNKDVNKLIKNFRLSFDNMDNSRNSFIVFWYAYALKYFGRKIMAVKYYLEVETMFKFENNTLGVENVLLELAEVFLIINEIEQASDYLNRYNEGKKMIKKALKSNECLFNLVKGELALKQTHFKKALIHLENALKCQDGSLIDNDLKDFIYTLLIRVYKEINHDKYIDITNELKSALNLTEIKCSTVFLLKHEYNEKDYEDYIIKKIIPNKSKISNRNYTTVISDYRNYLLAKRKYALLSKIGT